MKPILSISQTNAKCDTNFAILYEMQTGILLRCHVAYYSNEMQSVFHLIKDEIVSMCGPDLIEVTPFGLEILRLKYKVTRSTANITIERVSNNSGKPIYTTSL